MLLLLQCYTHSKPRLQSCHGLFFQSALRRTQQQIFVNRKKGRRQVNLVSDKSQSKHLVPPHSHTRFNTQLLAFVLTILRNSSVTWLKVQCDCVITQSDIIVISCTRGGQIKSYKINDSSMFRPIIWWPSDSRAVKHFDETIQVINNMQDGSTQTKELKMIVLIMMCLFLTLPSPSLSCPIGTA